MIYLSENEQKAQKKKKKQLIVLETEKVESELPELVEVLEELEKEKKYVDIQVCPHCKSPKVRRVNSMEGDMLGHMGLTPPKYQCPKCGWITSASGLIPLCKCSFPKKLMEEYEPLQTSGGKN